MTNTVLLLSIFLIIIIIIIIITTLLLPKFLLLLLSTTPHYSTTTTTTTTNKRALKYILVLPFIYISKVIGTRAIVVFFKQCSKNKIKIYFNRLLLIITIYYH